MTKVARQVGLTSERWLTEDYNLSTESGFRRAERRLRIVQPRRLWLMPECGRNNLKQWHNCIRLAWLQLELGGYFYIEQPQTCYTWKLKDMYTRQLLDNLSSHCIRDQCFDGLVHPDSGKPVWQVSRIQSNDYSFTLHFGQRCIGHETEHTTAIFISDTSHYPKPFCNYSSRPTLETMG